MKPKYYNDVKDILAPHIPSIYLHTVTQSIVDVMDSQDTEASGKCEHGLWRLVAKSDKKENVWVCEKCGGELSGCERNCPKVKPNSPDLKEIEKVKADDLDPNVANASYSPAVYVNLAMKLNQLIDGFNSILKLIEK